MRVRIQCLAASAAIVLAFALADAGPAAARDYKWCAWVPSFGSGASSSCAFETLEQCREEVHGLGGWCNLNPYYNAAVEERAYREPPRRRVRAEPN